MKGVVVVIAVIAAVVGGLALLGNRDKSASEKCNEKHGYTQRCLDIAEGELKAAEYGSVKAAHEAEHDEQIEEEVGEVEEIIKQRQAEKTAGELEGLR
jgi:hypothetical protein